MNKAMIIQELNMARVAHERWVKRAEHLVSGMPVDKAFIPLEPMLCGFGEWYYGMVGRTLRSMYIFTPTMETIEACHNELHRIYHRIYDIYFEKPKKRSFLEKIMTFNNKSITKKEKKEADSYLMLLQETSDELIYHLDKLEKAVRVADLVVLKRTQGAQKHA